MPVPLPRPAFLVPTLLLLLGGCGAEDTNGSSPGADEVEPFRPGLHSLMIEMQFRHANIWFSGDAENWPLADYQLHEMEELVEDIVDFPSGVSWCAGRRAHGDDHSRAGGAR